MASRPHMFVTVSGFGAASTLIEAVKRGAVKDVNHVIASAAFDSRKLAQRVVDDHIEKDTPNSKKSVYYKIRRNRDRPWTAYIRISQRKWNAILRFVLDGGVRKGGENVKTSYVAVPAKADNVSRNRRRRLYRFAKQVEPSDGVKVFDAPGKRRKIRAVPLRKDPKGRLLLLEIMRRGVRHFQPEAWLKQETRYEIQYPKTQDVFRRIVDRMLAKNADRVFGTEIRKEVKRNSRRDAEGLRKLGK